MKTLKIGRDIGGMSEKDLDIILSQKSNAIQIYLSDKLSFDPGPPLTKEAVKFITALQKHNDLHVVVHGKLIPNFCQDDQRNIQALTCDMIEAAKINADIVLHQGKNTKKVSREVALSRYVINLQEALDQTSHLRNRILLENSCQQGSELGYNLEDLVTIWRLVCALDLEKENESDEESYENENVGNDDDDDDNAAIESNRKEKRLKYRDRIGFCLDLCHAHVGGMIDMCDPDDVVRVMDEFHQKIGLQNLKLIHFNDSEIPFDGHNDSHAALLMGFIGNPDLGGNSLGFRKIVEYASRFNIPIVLETSNIIPWETQIALVRGWANLSEDIEEAYLLATQEIRDTFTNNPKSRKGRRGPRSSSKPVVKRVKNPPMVKVLTASAARNPPIIPIIKQDECQACTSGTSLSSLTSITELAAAKVVKPKLKIVPICKPASSSFKLK